MRGATLQIDLPIISEKRHLRIVILMESDFVICELRNFSTCLFI